MLFIKIFLLAVLSFFHVQAVLSQGDEALVVIRTEDSIHGPLVFYGLAGGANSETVSARLRKRACGTNNVLCSGTQAPDNQSCQYLINSLSANNCSVINDSPRSVCQTTNGNQCCINWANAASGLSMGMLAPAANAVQHVCIVNGWSGVSRNTNLNGVCTTQCLSNVASGCT